MFTEIYKLEPAQRERVALASVYIKRWTRSVGSRAELLARAVRLTLEGVRALNGEHLAWLAVLSIVQTGLRRRERVAGVYRFLVRTGRAEIARPCEVADFVHNGHRWVVRNHPDVFYALQRVRDAAGLVVYSTGAHDEGERIN